MSKIWVVFIKEVIDNLRDRRSLMSALGYPLLGPILVAVMLILVGRNFTERAEETLILPVIGVEHAPNLIGFLEEQNVEIVSSPPNPKESVRLGDEDVILVISEGYGEQFRMGNPASVQLITDDSRQTSLTSIRRVRSLLSAYSQQIGSLRLIARGINPAMTQALQIETVNLSTPQSQAAQMLNIAPYFIIFSIFIGGMYLAIDTTAGEKERGSLEPLLINPIRRSELVLGKIGAVLLFTLAGVLETLAGFAIVFNLIPLENFIGIRINLEPSSLMTIFTICMPMMVLAAALQLIIATFTKGFKEAQNYLSFLPLIPALPGMFLTFLPIRPEPWNMIIPTLGQQLLINQVLRGEAINPTFGFISAAATIGISGLLILVAIRLYSKESVLFGK